MSTPLADQLICDRLLNGRSLEDLYLDHVDGRILIEDLTVPEPQVTDAEPIPSVLTLGLFGKSPFITGVKWQNLHFKNCKLTDLSFSKSSFFNCKFERCDLRESGFWRCRVSDCSFERCDMRGVAFGGCLYGWWMPRNVFRSVSFDRCNLVRSGHSYELYKNCTFRNCRYGACNFTGAVFEDCRFIGKLDSAIFSNRDSNYRWTPANRLLRTDFREADITDASFNHLDIDPAWFPSNDDVIILHRGPEDWRRLLRDGHVEPTEGMVWYIEEMAKHAGTPSITTKTGLKDVFTPKQIEALAAIAEKQHPGQG